MTPEGKGNPLPRLMGFVLVLVFRFASITS
jgi:hypothetical protein